MTSDEAKIDAAKIDAAKIDAAKIEIQPTWVNDSYLVNTV